MIYKNLKWQIFGDHLTLGEGSYRVIYNQFSIAKAIHFAEESGADCLSFLEHGRRLLLAHIFPETASDADRMAAFEALEPNHALREPVTLQPLTTG